MKLLVLNINENKELLNELNRHYISDSFSGSIENLLSSITCEFDLDDNMIFMSGLSGDLYKVFLFVIDKIILDNIFKYIVYKKVDNFINLVNNNTLHMDIYVNNFYISPCIEVIQKHINFTEEEKYSLERIFNYSILKIISDMYTYNTKFLNPVLMKLFDSLYDSVGHINFNYYKFELDPYHRPMIFYNEKESNACFHH